MLVDVHVSLASDVYGTHSAPSSFMHEAVDFGFHRADSKRGHESMRMAGFHNPVRAMLTLQRHPPHIHSDDVHDHDALYLPYRFTLCATVAIHGGSCERVLIRDPASPAELLALQT